MKDRLITEIQTGMASVLTTEINFVNIYAKMRRRPVK